MDTGILLYGPPASGKDTVTAALTALDASYAPFARLKIGTGRTHGYRMGTRDQLAELEERGEVIYRNDRYDSTYVVDQPGLDMAMDGGQVPIVHLGQVEGVQRVADGYAARWWRVLLWCPRDVTALRSVGRGDADTPARLAAWDATERDLDLHPGVTWDLTIHTDRVQVQDAAAEIHALVWARS
ncbi:guanylate kinase [Streptomyces sp. NPDC060232]|uniref:guanylate kinase n=1 Tax=Streptomyces sp. NPDC060232 TaxID=3347079 RepID=UPI00365E4BC3